MAKEKFLDDPAKKRHDQLQELKSALEDLSTVHSPYKKLLATIAVKYRERAVKRAERHPITASTRPALRPLWEGPVHSSVRSAEAPLPLSTRTPTGEEIVALVTKADTNTTS